MVLVYKRRSSKMLLHNFCLKITLWGNEKCVYLPDFLLPEGGSLIKETIDNL